MSLNQLFLEYYLLIFRMSCLCSEVSGIKNIASVTSARCGINEASLNVECPECPHYLNIGLLSTVYYTRKFTWNPKTGNWDIDVFPVPPTSMSIRQNLSQALPRRLRCRELLHGGTAQGTPKAIGHGPSAGFVRAEGIHPV